MSHIVIKYTKGGRYEQEGIDQLKGWHLESKVGDGEFTACGNAIVEYDHERKLVEKGGITCKNCLENIRYYKTIKL